MYAIHNNDLSHQGLYSILVLVPLRTKERKGSSRGFASIILPLAGFGCGGAILVAQRDSDIKAILM